MEHLITFKLVLTFVTLTCFRTPRYSLYIRIMTSAYTCIRSTRILMADKEKEITACGNFI